MIALKIVLLMISSGKAGRLLAM